ncbi:glycosyltransferase [Alteribacter populi]|uniref:glycosyltransferase n=1 Tax=Alteribacter populi TaxID=2011011 RepID=UPI000BBA56E3|nr:glycosyltransferase [Alteribacter populi]
MKKKLLFVIDSLTIGGAEKSLVSLLNLINHSKYEIDLLLFKRGGDLEKLIPKKVNVLPLPEYFSFLAKKRFRFKKNLLYSSYKYKTSFYLRLPNYKNLHSEQIVYENIKNILNPLQQKYDVAIAYSQGMPTYFVANKVKADKKLAWINTDYVNTLYNKNLDYKSYKCFNKIIAVSKNTKDSVAQLSYEYSNKLEIILDIIDPNLLFKMAEEHKVLEYDQSVINILSVGRLETVKAYEKAIEVAKILKNRNVKFKWFVIGEGSERKNLQQLVDNHQLKDVFIFLGKKINPYSYMKKCDLYVQTSLKEGFGLTVCEAKILKKPIVCTNFPTAREIINHETDGLIVDHDIESIYQGIIKYLENSRFRERIIEELSSQNTYSSINEVEKLYKLI